MSDKKAALIGTGIGIFLIIIISTIQGNCWHFTAITLAITLIVFAVIMLPLSKYLLK